MVNQFSVTYVATGWPNAYQETFTAVRPGWSADYRLAVPTTRLIAPFAVGYGPAESIGVGIRIDARASAVDLLKVRFRSLRGYATESTVPAPGLGAQVNLVNGRLTGLVKNGSNVHLIDAVLLAGTSIITLGDLPAGASVPIDAGLNTATSRRGSLTSWQIYPTSGPHPSATPLKGDGRISLLQLILGEYDTASAQLEPTLIAWTPDVVEPITMNGGRPQIVTQNVIVVPLTIKEISGPLPPGFIGPRLIDATGLVTLDPYGTAVAGGSLTYEFSLPMTSRARISGLSLRHVIAPGPFVLPAIARAGSQPVASSALWDWSRSAWVAVTLLDGGATPLPQATLQPENGLVRLRFESVAGASFRLGALWLEGSVMPSGS